MTLKEVTKRGEMILAVLVIVSIIISAGVLINVGKNSTRLTELSIAVTELVTTERDLVDMMGDLAKVVGEGTETMAAIEDRLKLVEESIKLSTPEQELIVGILMGPSTLNPHRGGATGRSTMLVNEPYFISYEGEFYPHLVESYDISPDGLLYTWHLKRGVKFHNGEPFNAEAVKFSFEYASDPKSPRYMSFDCIDLVEVIDEYTVDIHMKYLNSWFIESMGDVAIGSPVSRLGVEEFGEDYGISGWYGTGPFKIVELVYGSYATYERFEEYDWAPEFTGHEGPAVLKRIIQKVIPDPTVLTVSLLSGDIDVIDSMPIWGGQYPLLNASKTHTIFSTEAYHCKQVIFQQRDPPFNDIRARRAIAYAINREELSKLRFGLEEQAFQMCSSKLGAIDKPDLVPPGMPPGFDDTISTYDPAKGRALLEYLGWKTGEDGYLYNNTTGEIFELTIMTGSGKYKDFLVVLASQLEEIGIKADTRRFDWPIWSDLAGVAGDYSIGCDGWTLKGYWGLADVFHSRTLGVGYNYAWVDDTELDALLDEGPKITDRNTRLAHYQKILDKVARECMYISFLHTEVMGARANYVINLDEPWDIEVKTDYPWMLLDTYIDFTQKP